MVNISKLNALTQIKNLFDSKLINNLVKSQGWVQSIRKHKNTIFLHINDGSTLKHLQIIIPVEQYNKDINYGCCVEVEGELVKSPREQQPIEIVAKQITVLGACNDSFPIKLHQNQSFDSLRQYPHLRQRTQILASLMRIRNAANFAMHQYFQSEGFVHITTPILTTNDCEGGGDTFQVGVANQENEKSFFSESTFLTVSSQLHLEASASALSRVYTISPTFRAENNNTRHHVSEFTMVEAEMAFINSTDDLTLVVEDLLKFTIEKLLDSADMQFFINKISPGGHMELIEKILKTPFKRISYCEALDILKGHQSEFKTKINEWGCDLQREHEQFLVQNFDSIPVFVYDYPTAIKPFYAKVNDHNNKTVSAFDLLGPRVGEICGGSIREDNLDILEKEIVRQKINGLDWYLDLRRYGTYPHGGFGIGFDRFLQVLLAIPNIRDVIPYPRYANTCKL